MNSFYKYNLIFGQPDTIGIILQIHLYCKSLNPNNWGFTLPHNNVVIIYRFRSFSGPAFFKSKKKGVWKNDNICYSSISDS